MRTLEAVYLKDYIDGLVQDCSNSIANALELLQSCTEPSLCSVLSVHYCVLLCHVQCIPTHMITSVPLTQN